jgi:hypothetical protein
MPEAYAGMLKHSMAKKSERRGERRMKYGAENSLPGFATQ